MNSKTKMDRLQGTENMQLNKKKHQS